MRRGTQRIETVSKLCALRVLRGDKSLDFQTVSSLSSKQDQTIDEIRALRGDLKSYIEWRTEKLKSELKEEIRTEFDERIRALKAHELCADVTG